MPKQVSLSFLKSLKQFNCVQTLRKVEFLCRLVKEQEETSPYYLLLLSTIDNIEVSAHTYSCLQLRTFILSFLMLVLSGKLEKGAVLKAICAGFEETTEPAVCLSDGECT